MVKVNRHPYLSLPVVHYLIDLVALSDGKHTVNLSAFGANVLPGPVVPEFFYAHSGILYST